MSKAIESLKASLGRARAAKAEAENELALANSAASAGKARIATADVAITDIEAAIVTLGGTVER